MGREVKRVAFDFDWPLNERWRGYINPHYRKCPDCECGETASSEALSHLVHLILIGGMDSTKGTLHPWLRESGVRSVGTELHEISSGLAGRSADRPFGHDACDRWSAVKKIVEAAGLDPETWGTCPTCDGHAIHPDHREAYEAWEPCDPPTGDGWQMWETVSEGSPISPVCESPEALARWLADNNASASGHQGATYSQWLGMIRAGWAPTMVGSSEYGLESGVASIGREQK